VENMRISSIAVTPSPEKLGDIDARIIFASADQKEQKTTPSFGLDDARQLLSMLNDVVRDAEENELDSLISYANHALCGLELDLMRNVHAIVCGILCQRGDEDDLSEMMEGRISLSADDFINAGNIARSVSVRFAMDDYADHLESVFPVTAKLSKLSHESLGKVKTKLEEDTRITEL
jgi:hypothetical protein